MEVTGPKISPRVSELVNQLPSKAYESYGMTHTVKARVIRYEPSYGIPVI